MLEQGYWIAEILAAVVAVVGFLLWRRRGAVNVNQNAKVSGQGNTVNQRSDSKNGEGNGD